MTVIEPRPERDPAGAPQPRPAPPAQRILVVDDEIAIRQIITEFLVDSGYHVDVAENGAIAWDTLQINGYDLMVTDNSMPKVTGLDLLKKLHAARIDMPIIMATGTLPQEEFDRDPGIQPNATLLKPYTLSKLLESVKEVLSASETAREQIISPPNWTDQPATC